MTETEADRMRESNRTEESNETVLEVTVKSDLAEVDLEALDSHLSKALKPGSFELRRAPGGGVS